MQEPGYSAPIPSPTGESYSPFSGAGGTSGGGNDSGMGAQSQLPPELQGFNVGALLLNWIWAIGHQTWIGLLCFVPCVGWVMAIVLGLKGNEYAWQNRKWDSIEQFKATQKAWMMWGIGIWCIVIVLNVVFGGLGILMSLLGNR